MGSHKKTTTQIKFPVSHINAELFDKFNIVRIVRGLDKETAFAELVEAELVRRKDILAQRWVKWDELENELQLAGFTVNRQTVWNYRKNGTLADMVKSDGIDTLYNLDAILGYFQSK